MTRWCLTLAVLAAVIPGPSSPGQSAVSATAFSYQGRLNAEGSPANGFYDLRFAIFNFATNGNQVGPMLTQSGIATSNGLFTVTLDFGAGSFDGSGRWLEIAVRTNGAGPFNMLSPRQMIARTPYAITASRVTGEVAATNLTGVIPDAQLAPNVARLDRSAIFTGPVTARLFQGDASGLTNLNVTSLVLPGATNPLLSAYAWATAVPNTNSLIVSDAGDPSFNGAYKFQQTVRQRFGTLAIWTNSGATRFLLHETPPTAGFLHYLLASSTNTTIDTGMAYATEETFPGAGWYEYYGPSPPPAVAYEFWSTNYDLTPQAANWTLFAPHVRWMDLTNANGAGITNLQGGNLSAGTLNSNALDAASWFAATNVPPATFADLRHSTNLITFDLCGPLQPTPAFGVNNWLDYWNVSNGDPGLVIASNSLMAMKTNGMLAAGWNWISIDDGWAGGRQGGQLVVNSNKWPHGMAWFADFCHTNGFKLCLWLGWDLGIPAATLETLATDVRTLMSWGVDGVSVDTSLGHWAANRPTLDEVRAIMRILAQASADYASDALPGFRNRGIVSLVGVNTFDHHLRIPPEAVLCVNGVLPNAGYDFVAPHAIAQWAKTNGLTLGWLTRPGHWPHMNAFRQSNVYFDTNTFRIWSQILSMTGAGYWSALNTFANPGFLKYMTNREFMSLWADPAMIAGHVLSSNNFNEVWLRPIGAPRSGSNLVCFINGATNGNAGFTITASDLGVSSNTLLRVRDPINLADVATFSGMWTYVLSQTNVAQFHIFPDPYAVPVLGDGGGLTNLSASSIASGIIADARLGGTVARLSAGNALTNPIAGTLTNSITGNAATATAVAFVTTAALTNAINTTGNITGAVVRATGQLIGFGTLTNLVERVSSRSWIKGNAGSYLSPDGADFLGAVDGIVAAGNATCSFSIDVPAWVTNVTCTLAFAHSQTGNNAWTNTIRGVYHTLTNSTQITITNAAVVCGQSPRVRQTLTVTFPANTNVFIAKQIAVVMNTSTNANNRYVLGPAVLTLR